MAHDQRLNDALRTKAEAIVREIPDKGDSASTETDQTVIAALTEDLAAKAEQSAVAQGRLAKIEAQTRGLAEAVIAITAQAPAVAPAVQAVKDEMSSEATTPHAGNEEKRGGTMDGTRIGKLDCEPPSPEIEHKHPQDRKRVRRLEDRQAKMVERMRAQTNAVVLVEKLATVDVKVMAAAGMCGFNLAVFVAESREIVKALTTC